MDRPSDNEEQKKFFSGKKKQHTVKNQIVSLPEGKDIVSVQGGRREIAKNYPKI
ncbi:transposase family protein [uncultured Nostoc sp.]|uniref:transposase family protein n=1 Tax=uncultured Nostoc sp. TaxID=340711 RepID=UPI0035CB5D9B